MSLSLAPRYDLFRFALPKDFLPKSIEEKYMKLINKNPGVFRMPIDYLNESIQKVHIPGISGLVMEQQQHEFNPIKRENGKSGKLGRINVEPSHTVSYKSTGNPLEKMEREFKVTFRMNQGLYNYFMLYETIFYYYVKHIDTPSHDVMYIEILNEKGVITGRIYLKDIHIDGIEGLDFEYDKTTRESGQFDLTFKFNNIDFDFLIN